MTIGQPDDLTPGSSLHPSQRTPRLHKHYSSFAGICLYIGLFTIVRSIRGIAGATEPVLPADPAERDGAVLATILIIATSCATAAYFYLKRPKSPQA